MKHSRKHGGNCDNHPVHSTFFLFVFYQEMKNNGRNIIRTRLSAIAEAWKRKSDETMRTERHNQLIEVLCIFYLRRPWTFSTVHQVLFPFTVGGVRLIGSFSDCLVASSTAEEVWVKITYRVVGWRPWRLKTSKKNFFNAGEKM